MWSPVSQEASRERRREARKGQECGLPMSQVETQRDIGFQGSFSMCTAGQAKGMVSGQLPHLVTEPELQPPSLPGTAASAPLRPPGTPPIKCVILLLWPCLLERGRVASSTVRGDGSGSAPPQTSKEAGGDGQGWQVWAESHPEGGCSPGTRRAQGMPRPRVLPASPQMLGDLLSCARILP